MGITPIRLTRTPHCRKLAGVSAGEADIPGALSRTIAKLTTKPPGIRQSRMARGVPFTSSLSRGSPPERPLAQADRLKGPLHTPLRDEERDLPRPRCLPPWGSPPTGRFSLGKPNETRSRPEDRPLSTGCSHPVDKGAAPFSSGVVPCSDGATPRAGAEH